ncbi:CaiB/BaiF CoA-transferase family protein [Chitinophaga sp. Cy-1792]|uniref:CaiB/BaiF CoA transferase family protein n=1 Tax=Chitinophaga sp. Cy-1792 TaxID=2608339 RepID=UPI001F0450EC|nr:CaiB/BaiF CoA-transferase family protein [Chitinophaga sp. Cy-1792]
MDLPLEGITVLEFSQYLSGPSAGLRLADLGARVIKIERPVHGEAGRKLSIKNLWVDDSSLLFHTINRNKESFAADLKNPDDLALVKQLIAKADVLIHNFRPGVMQKIGLDYDAASEINPGLVYAEITGYGKEGPWKEKPGQDLLMQSLTGLTFTTGNATNGPVPFGISIADILCGAQLVQGIIAALIRRSKKKTGALIEVSLMETLLDFQFELLTTYYNSQQQPLRSKTNSGHTLLGAPYGVYKAADGFIALAMMDIAVLAETVECAALQGFTTSQAFAQRDNIKSILADHLHKNTVKHWLQKLQERGLWAMEVLDWEKMTTHDAYRALQMEQVLHAAGKEIITTRCPIRINGQRLVSGKPAPKVGEHNEMLIREMNEVIVNKK